MAQEIILRDDQRYCDDESRLFEGGVYVWDTDSLTWVKMKQPTMELSIGDLTVTMGDVERLLAKTYWLDQQYDYASATVLYVGRSTTHKASEDSGNNWWVIKFTFNAAGKVTRIEGPLNGNWSSRASMDWA